MEELSDSPHMSAKAWTLSIFAVPVLYLLSVPPMYTFARGTGTWGHSGAIQRDEIPPWVETYAVPFGWVGEHTLLREPLGAYLKWWLYSFDPLYQHH
jgi:hypothetical protein